MMEIKKTFIGHILQFVSIKLPSRPMGFEGSFVVYAKNHIENNFFLRFFTTAQ